MERIHESLPIREFTLPDSVEKASVCSITGLRATSSCPTTSELFAKGDLPDEYCSGHVVETPEEETEETDDDANGDTDRTDAASYTTGDANGSKYTKSASTIVQHFSYNI